MTPDKKYALIVAGGSGLRMNSNIPKQFLKLDGLPILMHTINKFATLNLNIEIIVVLPFSNITHWKELCFEYDFTTHVTIVEGGETRFHSVKNGLNEIRQKGVIAIHDAVRPLVASDTIRNGYEVAGLKGNAVPCITIADSIRQITAEGNTGANRNNYRIIQTPQCFRSDIIQRAYLQEYDTAFTDDASVAEAAGETINLINGSSDNLKITTPQDMIIAEALLHKAIASPEMDF